MYDFFEGPLSVARIYPFLLGAGSPNSIVTEETSEEHTDNPGMCGFGDMLVATANNIHEFHVRSVVGEVSF